MAEIKYPAKRTFWKFTSSDGKVTHEGYTDIDQVTTTAFPVYTSATLATTIFPALPSSGELKAGTIYSYNGGMVIVMQDHARTIYPPEQTPALFSVYRANTEGAEWVANEKVEKGDIRTYKGKTYQCLQSHQTLSTWTPDKTLGVLWGQVVLSNEWAVGVAYKVGDIVTYKGKTYKCLQAHTSQAGWYPSAVPALWQLQKK